jgi:RNA polymerase sigma-70 factor, ECF subfamily
VTVNGLSRGQATAEEFGRHLTSNLNLLWRLGLYLCGHAIQAEALVERIASHAWEQRATLADSGKFNPWLLALAVQTWQREFTDPLPGSPPYLAASVGDAYELTGGAGYQVDDDPAAELADRLNREDVCRAFMRIPPADRAVIALSLVGDLSYSDLGSILGLPRETIRERLQRGRAALKVALWEVGSEK